VRMGAVASDVSASASSAPLRPGAARFRTLKRRATDEAGRVLTRPRPSGLLRPRGVGLQPSSASRVELGDAEAEDPLAM
jgi:hypothetical protein